MEHGTLVCSFILICAGFAGGKKVKKVLFMMQQTLLDYLQYFANNNKLNTPITVYLIIFSTFFNYLLCHIIKVQFNITIQS